MKKHQVWLAAGTALLALGGCTADRPAAAPATPTAAGTGSLAAEGPAVGVPPEPAPGAAGAYLAELRLIDPAIVTGHDERALVEQGREQCASIKDWPDDQDKLVELTNRRFTAEAHPDGFGTAKSTKILLAVRRHICPTY